MHSPAPQIHTAPPTPHPPRDVHRRPSETRTTHELQLCNSNAVNPPHLLNGRRHHTSFFLSNQWQRVCVSVCVSPLYMLLLIESTSDSSPRYMLLLVERKSGSPPLSLLLLTISKPASMQLYLSLGNDHKSGSMPLYALRLTEIKSGSSTAIFITVERNQ